MIVFQSLLTEAFFRSIFILDCFALPLDLHCLEGGGAPPGKVGRAGVDIYQKWDKKIKDYLRLFEII